MKASEFKKNKITRIYTDANKYGVGKRIILLFENGIAMLIDRYWGYCFRVDKILKDKITALNEMKIISENTFLENVMSIEGVSAFVKLSNGYYIYLYHQVEDLERLSFYHRVSVFNVISDPEKYEEIQEEVDCYEDVVFEKCNNIELKLN